MITYLLCMDLNKTERTASKIKADLRIVKIVIFFFYNLFTHESNSWELVKKCPCVPFRIGILKCWFLKRGENRSTWRKTSRSKGENQQQTQPTYGVDAGIWTHHCATLAPPVHTRIKASYFSCLVQQEPGNKRRPWCNRWHSSIPIMVKVTILKFVYLAVPFLGPSI